MKKTILIVAIFVLVAVLGSTCFYTVREDQFACVFRFSEIVSTTGEPGLHFKVPFVDKVQYFSKATQLYDIPPSEVTTFDKQNMTVDCYILWKIDDPQQFYRALGTTAKAEDRLDSITYGAVKREMGKLAQADIINMEDGALRNEIYEGIATIVSEGAKAYGIIVEDVKIKQFDLPESNLNAVYQRMISERNQMAEKFTADGDKEANLIINEAVRHHAGMRLKHNSHIIQSISQHILYIGRIRGHHCSLVVKNLKFSLFYRKRLSCKKFCRYYFYFYNSRIHQSNRLPATVSNAAYGDLNPIKMPHLIAIGIRKYRGDPPIGNRAILTINSIEIHGDIRHYLPPVNPIRCKIFLARLRRQNIRFKHDKHQSRYCKSRGKAPSYLFQNATSLFNVVSLITFVFIICHYSPR